MQMEVAAGARRSPHNRGPVNAKPAWKFYFPGGFTDSRESDELRQSTCASRSSAACDSYLNSRTNLPALFTGLSI